MPIQIKFTTRTNLTLLFAVNTKFDDNPLTHPIEANEKEKTKPGKEIFFVFLASGTQKILATRSLLVTTG